ncbi:hypothetical protein N9X61_03310 [Sulfurimonas sp.]|nr:hypothetical protein [Sulfurimonas sp.]
MIKILSNIKLPGSILKIEIVDDFIYILDNKFTLIVYSNSTFTLIDKHILLHSQDDKHIYENTLAISKNLDFYHSFTKDTSGAIFNLEDDKISQSLPIELNKRDVSYARFSNNADILLIGGEDGRSCFYDLRSKRSCFSLEARSDFISSAVFSNDDKLVCIGAYDKAIKIHDIDKHKVIAEVDVSDTPEDLVFLDNMSGVIGITRDRKIFLYSINDDTLIYANMLFAEWPTSIVKVGHQHILIGTKGDILYILDIKDLSLVRRFRIKNFGIKTLKTYENKLYIGYSSGELKIIDMNYMYDTFEESLKMNKFAKATSLMKENIFLMTKEITQKYDNIWEQVLDMAKDVLLMKDLEKAQRMVKPFLWDKRKKDQFEALQVNIGDIKHFESLVTQGSNVLAFKFADEKTHLQEHKQYLVIEADFNKKFHLAKSLFAKDTNPDIQSAKNIITPFLKIESKKPLINNLLTNYKIFSRSLRLIKSRNFKVYFRLVEKNEFLKDEHLYPKIVEIGNQAYSKLLTMEQEGQYEKASQVADYLEDFIPFNQSVDDIRDIIDSKMYLQQLIRDDNIKKIYQVVSQSSELELTPMFNEYHKIFEAKKEEANLFAHQGNSPKVKETLENHLEIQYLINSIAMIFKLSYLVEIELVMESSPHSINMHATMERYAMLFGIDDELDLLAKKLNFTHLVPNYPPNPIGFETNDFYSNIVVKAS